MKTKKITKIDLIEEIYNTTELNLEKKDIQNIADAFLSQIKKSLESGSVIELRGFGTFEPRLRKEKNKARNPKTGEIVSVGAHYVAAFRAGQELKENLWKLNPDAD